MSKSNLKIAPALKPRSTMANPVSPCVFYRMHERSGTVLVDSLGYGPDITLAGTGAPWANVPWVTTNGTDDYGQVAASAMGGLTDLLRLDATYGHIIAALDFYYDGDATANEQITFAGVSDNLVGGWGLGLNSSEQVQITHRALGATNHTDSNFTGYSLAALANTRVSIVVELIRKTATTFDGVLFVNGVARSTLADVNMLANSGTAVYAGPAGSSVQGFSLACRPSGTATRDRYMNSGASNGRVARLLMFRGATRDTALALKVAQEMYAYQGEFPVCLDGL